MIYIGVTCFCGRQGSGKTLGVVETLERIREQYPNCIICTNINYVKQDIAFTSWLQLLYLRNGENGVVFVIDEVQNNGLDWTKFPETLMQVVTMQRKQKIKIYLTAQVYKSVVIQLRRQCFDVVECKTFLGRWTRHKCYDAEEYNTIIDKIVYNYNVIENSHSHIKLNKDEEIKRNEEKSDTIINTLNNMKNMKFVIKKSYCILIYIKYKIINFKIKNSNKKWYNILKKLKNIFK